MKKIIALLLTLLSINMGFGQVAGLTLMPPTIPQFFDLNGKVLSFGLIYTYASGTTTLLATYGDQAGFSQNANPIILNGSGFNPNGGIFLKPQSYKICVFDAFGSAVQPCLDTVISWNVLNGVTLTNAIISTATITNGTLNTGSLTNFTITNSSSTNEVLSTPTITNPTVSTGTFTGPTLVNPIFSGTYTLASPTITNPTITGGTESGTTRTTGTLDNTPIGSVTPSTGVFSSLTGPLTGNSSTATALQVAPTPCGTVGALLETGIGATGTPTTCGPNIRWGTHAGAGCTTGSSTYSACTDSGTWSSSFPNTNKVFVSCIAGSVSDPRAIIQLATGTQSGFSYQVVTEGSVAVNVSDATCIGVQI